MDDFNAKVRAYLGSLTHFHAVPADRSGVCRVCCGPTGVDRDDAHYPTCRRCDSMDLEAQAAGMALADTTVFVIYALQYRDKSSDMALDDMYSYKNPKRTPARRHQAGARIAALLYSTLHSLESRRRIGGAIHVGDFRSVECRRRLVCPVEGHRTGTGEDRWGTNGRQYPGLDCGERAGQASVRRRQVHRCRACPASRGTGVVGRGHVGVGSQCPVRRRCTTCSGSIVGDGLDGGEVARRTKRDWRVPA